MVELFWFTRALYALVLCKPPGSSTGRGAGWGERRPHAGWGLHFAHCSLASPRVLKLSKNPCYFLKPNSLSLTLVWCQPGLQESLLSTVMVAKKLPHLLKMKTKQKKITSPASVKSKDTRQQFKQSPRIQTNKDACQGLRGKKWHSCSTTLAKLYEPFYFQGCRQMPPEI